MSSLIFDIERLSRDFKLNKVKLFIPENYSLYSMAAASALGAYLTQVCHLETVLVANQEKVNDVSVCLPLVENGEGIEEYANDFIAIILDCPRLEACENEHWNKTFCILEIRGEVDMKDFGVNGYNEKTALCAAEIIYNAIVAHQKVYNQPCPEALNYLFLAMLDATSNFYLHLRTNTFNVIQELILAGADVKVRPECFIKKDIDEINLLQYIYTQSIIADRVGYVVIPYTEEINKIPAANFTNVLEYIRYLKIVDIWILFVENGKGNYTCYLQGSASGKFDVTKMVKPFGGTGSKKKSKVKIEKNKLDELVSLSKKTIAYSLNRYSRKEKDIEQYLME